MPREVVRELTTFDSKLPPLADVALLLADEAEPAWDVVTAPFTALVAALSAEEAA